LDEIEQEIEEEIEKKPMWKRLLDKFEKFTEWHKSLGQESPQWFIVGAIVYVPLVCFGSLVGVSIILSCMKLMAMIWRVLEMGP